MRKYQRIIAPTAIIIVCAALAGCGEKTVTGPQTVIIGLADPEDPEAAEVETETGFEAEIESAMESDSLADEETVSETETAESGTAEGIFFTGLSDSIDISVQNIASDDPMAAVAAGQFLPDDITFTDFDLTDVQLP